MKIALIGVNAKYIHTNLALLNLKSYADKYQDHIAIAEYTINQMEDQILEEIYKLKADVLCFSCYIWNIQMIESLIRELEIILPNVEIWVGGPEVSFSGTAFLTTHPFVKGVMNGEGEETFLNLCHHYVKQSIELENIAGITIRFKNEIQTNHANSFVQMDQIPFGYDQIGDFDLAFANKIIYYESSRGCPFRCSYCLSSIDKQLRFKSLDKVFEELSFFIEKKVKQVKFVDRTFNCQVERSIAIWKFLKEKDNGITNFHFEIAADILTAEELQILGMMRPGQIQLEIGVQTTNPKTLEEIRRKMDFQKVAQFVEIIRKQENIHQHLDLIAGLPFEDYESFHRSFNEVFQIHPEQLQLGFLKVLKGSWMHENAKQYGLKYQTKPPFEVRSTNWISYEELLRLKRVEEIVEVYYNSHQFEATLKWMLLKECDYFSFFEKLGEYYENNNLFLRSHNRLARYEILWDFWCEQGNEKDEICMETLLFDLYLREEIKSRPFFLKEPKKIWKLPKEKGKRMHVEFFEYNLGLLDEEKEPIKKGEFLCFDYDHRNPLTNQAKVERISE